MPSAILVHWRSGYESIRGLVSHLGRIWQRQGFAIVEVDMSVAGWEAALVNAVGPADFRFALLTSGIGIQLQEDGQNFWLNRRVPVFCLHLDHPCYRQAIHQGQPTNIVQGYMFRDHALFQREHIGSPNLVTSLHYGVPDLPQPDTAEDGVRIVYPKTGGDPAELERIWRGLPAAPILFDLVDELGDDLPNCAAFPPAILKVAGAHGFEIGPFDKLFRFLLAQLDDYVRRRKSTMIAEALRAFPVDVYGRAWEHVAATPGRARFHGAVPYPQVERAIAGATATISMNPNIELSAHDRFFLALGAGGMPISDRNRFVREEFPDLLPYAFEFTPASIAAAIDRVVGNPRQAREVARSVKAVARSRFPTEKAAAHILDCARLVNFLEFDFAAPQPFFIP
jgi:hypothetical protein